MVEECGLLSNLLFHLMASYHIYHQALPPFPGLCLPWASSPIDSIYLQAQTCLCFWLGQEVSGLRNTGDLITQSQSQAELHPGCPGAPRSTAVHLMLGRRVRQVCFQIWSWPRPSHSGSYALGHSLADSQLLDYTRRSQLVPTLV